MIAQAMPGFPASLIACRFGRRRAFQAAAGSASRAGRLPDDMASFGICGNLPGRTGHLFATCLARTA